MHGQSSFVTKGLSASVHGTGPGLKARVAKIMRIQATLVHKPLSLKLIKIFVYMNVKAAVSIITYLNKLIYIYVNKPCAAIRICACVLCFRREMCFEMLF